MTKRKIKMSRGKSRGVHYPRLSLQGQWLSYELDFEYGDELTVEVEDGKLIIYKEEPEDSS